MIRTLIIEDSHSARDLINVVISNEMGYEADFCENAEEALTKVSENKYDLILLDWMLPDLDGVLLCRKLRTIPGSRNSLILMITAKDKTEDIVTAIKAGIDDYITKPFTPEQLKMRLTIAETRIHENLKHISMEKDLESAQNRYKTLFEESSDLILITNNNGNILYANPGLIRILEYSETETNNLNIIHLINTQTKDAFSRLFHTLTVENPMHRFSTELVSKSGQIHQVQGNAIANISLGQINEIRFLFRDLTEETRSRKNIRLSEAKIRGIFNAALDGIISIDKKGTIEMINPAALRLFGYTEQEVIGQNVRILAPSPHQENHDQYLTNYLTTGIKKIIGLQRELSGIRKDGSIFPMSLSVSEVEIEGEIIFIGTVHDLTARNENQKKLNEAKLLAEKANQAKSEFLSSMSHELRTPLNAISGFSQLLLSDPEAPLNNDQTELLTHIQKGGEHLLKLINEILDLAKIEAGQISMSLEPVDLDKLIRDCSVLIQPLATMKKINYTVNYAELAGRFVMADITRLKQVLLNLLSNGIKYNRENGSLVVSFENAGASLKISIKDTGQGIPENMLSQLFQPFSRLGQESGEIEGTGIGLTITKHIIELMHGKIGVESTFGKGSNFWITIPMAENDTTQVSEKMEPELMEVHFKDKYKILYVEDNPINLKLVEKIFNRFPDITLMSAPSGTLGLEVALGTKFDVIILDINLPGMNGFEILKNLKATEKTCKTPVIALSANAMQSEIDRGKQAGFYQYITKPINIQELVEAVHNAIQLSIEQNQPGKSGD